MTAAGEETGQEAAEAGSSEAAAKADAAEIVEYIKKLTPHEDLSVPGGIFLITEGDTELAFAFGDAELEPPHPMKTTDRFPIGDITKTLVTTVVLQLVDEGTLTLDDTVEKWKPGLLASGTKTTIEDLLSHRTGIFDVTDAAGENFDVGVDLTDEKLRELLDHPLTDPPGTKTRYSNPNFWVVGKIVEAATGHPLTSELERRVFTPAGMKTAHLSTNLDREPNLVHGYDEDDKDITPSDVTGLWAASGVVASAGDLGAFYRALYDGALLPEEMVTDMGTSRGTFPGEQAEYGLGTFVLSLDCGEEAVGHEGWIEGFHSFSVHSEEAGRTTVAFANTTSPVGEDTAPHLAISAVCYS